MVLKSQLLAPTSTELEMLVAYTPTINTTPNGNMIVTNRYERPIITPVTTEMVAMHMLARLRKWLQEKPKWQSKEEAITQNMFHTKVRFMVGDDHRYWRKILKYRTCPVCGASTDVE